jgi:hypothetical protein
VTQTGDDPPPILFEEIDDDKSNFGRTVDAQPDASDGRFRRICTFDGKSKLHHSDNRVLIDCFSDGESDLLASNDFCKQLIPTSDGLEHVEATSEMAESKCFWQSPRRDSEAEDGIWSGVISKRFLTNSIGVWPHTLQLRAVRMSLSIDVTSDSVYVPRQICISMSSPKTTGSWILTAV